jgi:hypothetical protein
VEKGADTTAWKENHEAFRRIWLFKSFITMSPDANNIVPDSKIPPLNADLMNLYNRIKDLYVQLGHEQRELQVAQRRLADLRQTEQQEQKINHWHRRRLLECIGDRNSVELEIFRVQDQIELCQAATVNFNQERVELEAMHQEVQDETKHQIDNVYGPQKLKMDLYMRALTETVQARQQKIQKRDDGLAIVRVKCKNLKAKEHTDKQEMARVRLEIVQLSETAPGGADEDISALSNMIRDVIHEVRRSLFWCPTKRGKFLGSRQDLTQRDCYQPDCHFSFILQRAQLRQDLKTAKDDNTKANEQLIEWEEKRVKFFVNNK